MTDDPTPTASVEEKMLVKTAKHIQTLTRGGADELAVDDIAYSLRQTTLEFSSGDTHGIQDMLVAHTKVLDSAFGWFLDRAGEHPKSAENSVALALKSQQQVIRTLMAWKFIRDDTRVKDAIVRHKQLEKGLLAELRREQQKRYDKFDFSSLSAENRDERTEQNAHDRDGF